MLSAGAFRFILRRYTEVLAALGAALDPAELRQGRSYIACHVISIHFEPSFLSSMASFDVAIKMLPGHELRQQVQLWKAAGAYTRPLFGSSLAPFLLGYAGWSMESR